MSGGNKNKYKYRNPMNPSPPYSSSEPYGHSEYGDHRSPSRSTVSWGAIIAGAVTALAIHVLFMMLGAGLGLAVYSPLTDDNPVAGLSIGAVIVHSVCAIIALCLGGMVAGRFTPVRSRSTGWLHGFNVWCAATVGGVIMVAIGASWMVAGASKMVGGGLSAVGQPAAEMASEAMNRSGETITSYVEEAVGNLPEDRPVSERVRATREVGMALGRLFNPAQEGDTTANREAAVNSLVQHTEMSRAEAERTITEWRTSFDRMQADLSDAKEAAAQKTREAADSTADALAKFSLWAFVGFLIGALAAAWGGHFGASCATKCELTDDPHTSRIS
jgi:hypothetical protein